LNLIITNSTVDKRALTCDKQWRRIIFISDDVIVCALTFVTRGRTTASQHRQLSDSYCGSQVGVLNSLRI